MVNLDAQLLQKLVQLEDTQQAQLALLTKIVAYLEAQKAPEQPPIASYGQLYPEEETVPVDETVALPVQPGGWRKRFPKKAK
jgi:hypothetical protein